MGYKERAEIYEKIEAERGRRLIAYVTSIRVNAAGSIAPDVYPHLIRQINAIPSNEKKVDLMVVSGGGDPVAAARIISLLLERFDEIGVLLPYVANSSATMLAMGADEIVMHSFANLGPVDIQVQMQNGSQANLEYLRNYFTFVREDAELTNPDQVGKALELLGNEVTPVFIGYMKQATKLSKFLSRELLTRHMKGDDAKNIEAIVEALGQSYPNHDYPLGRREAERLGLPIKRPSANLEQWMWEFWEDMEKEMQCNIPYYPMVVIDSNAQAQGQVFAPTKQLIVPNNVSAEKLDVFFKQASLKYGDSVQIPAIAYEQFRIALESVRCHSEFRVKGKILVTRMPDMSIPFQDHVTSVSWEFHDERKEVKR
jgi:Serine dehydrogenase proteinase